MLEVYLNKNKKPLSGFNASGLLPKLIVEGLPLCLFYLKIIQHLFQDSGLLDIGIL